MSHNDAGPTPGSLPINKSMTRSIEQCLYYGEQSRNEKEWSDPHFLNKGGDAEIHRQGETPAKRFNCCFFRDLKMQG